MPARLRPRPSRRESIVTVTSEPTFTDKRGIAEMFTVSTRTIDLWRTAGWFPSIKVGGNIRFNVGQCQLAFARHFTQKQGTTFRRPLRNSTRPRNEISTSELS